MASSAAPSIDDVFRHRLEYAKQKHEGNPRLKEYLGSPCRSHMLTGLLCPEGYATASTRLTMPRAIPPLSLALTDPEAMIETVTATVCPGCYRRLLQTVRDS